LASCERRGVDLYLHQQSLDTSTPAGKAMFSMLGVFFEFEREIIREGVMPGLARARAKGKKLGGPSKDTPQRIKAVRKMRKQGFGIVATAKRLGIGVGVVQRIDAGL
jgi:DNA invertase Pin-like site-specific DNA recombinase